MKNIAQALIKSQSEMSDAKKNSVNPFLKNSYADLNAIREVVIPVLNENKIAVLQPMIEINGEMYIKTLLLHESGETIESITKIIVSKLNDAQSQGSGITYARRYGLQSLLNVGAIDDDGNKSSNPVQAKPMATAEILAKAKATGATMAQIKTKYSVTAEQEKNY